MTKSLNEWTGPCGRWISIGSPCAVAGSGGTGGNAGTGGNGGSGGTSGNGGNAGTGGSGGMPDAGLPPCGGSNQPCGKDEYCDFDPDELCGIGKGAEGVCRPRPDSCTTDCPGVCACDGKLYCNACEAHRAGIDDTTDSSCKRPIDAGPGADCTNDNDCRLGLLCCDSSGPGNSRSCTTPTSQGDCP